MGEVIGLWRQWHIIRQADIFGVGADPDFRQSENLISRLEMAGFAAGFFYHPRQHASKYLLFWPEQSKEQPDHKRFSLSYAPVARIYGRGFDVDQDFIFPGFGLCQIHGMQHFGRTVVLVDYCFHLLTV